MGHPARGTVPQQALDTEAVDCIMLQRTKINGDRPRVMHNYTKPSLNQS
jgi:hypothetical protein